MGVMGGISDLISNIISAPVKVSLFGVAWGGRVLSTDRFFVASICTGRCGVAVKCRGHTTKPTQKPTRPRGTEPSAAVSTRERLARLSTPGSLAPLRSPERVSGSKRARPAVDA